MTGKKQMADGIDEKVRGDTIVKRSQLKAGAKGTTGDARKREAKAEERRERREKKLYEVIMEHEKKISGKTTCL